MLAATRLFLLSATSGMAKLIFGCGYLGKRVAELWKSAGSTVFAVTRSSDRAAQFVSAGLQPIVADITAEQKFQIPPEVRTVLFAVGYDRASGRSIQEVYADGLQRVLGSLPQTVERLIYISSTGVYGPTSAGDWVNEDTDCQPTREGGKASLAAERLLQNHPVFASRGIILRLAGIYGPGRIPRAHDLAAGKPIDAPAGGWLNLIHVDDAARIVLLAENSGRSPRLFAVSDGNPVVRGDYYRELARLLRAPEPSFIAPDPTSPAAQRAGSDKRVDNRRLCEELGPQFQFPSYRQGLASIVGGSQ
jgi:nucleoside-diphosphate-sugar epimerase